MPCAQCEQAWAESKDKDKPKAPECISATRKWVSSCQHCTIRRWRCSFSSLPARLIHIVPNPTQLAQLAASASDSRATGSAAAARPISGHPIARTYREHMPGVQDNRFDMNALSLAASSSYPAPSHEGLAACGTDAGPTERWWYNTTSNPSGPTSNYVHANQSSAAKSFIDGARFETRLTSPLSDDQSPLAGWMRTAVRADSSRSATTLTPPRMWQQVSPTGGLANDVGSVTLHRAGAATTT